LPGEASANSVVIIEIPKYRIACSFGIR